MSILKANRIENLTTTDGGINVNNSGQVGVGTSSPGANLEVRGSSSNGQIRIGGSTSGTYSQIYSDNDGVLILNADQGNNAASSYLGLNVDNTERLRIDSSGRVLIGTSSSTADGNADDLQIGAPTDSAQRGITVASSAAGSIRFADDGNNTAGYIFYSHSDNSLRFGSNGAEAARINSSGNVGIGTASPGSYYANQLVVDTGSAAQSGITIVSDSSNQGMFAFADGTSGADRYRGFLDYNHSNNSLAFGTNGSEQMRIDSSGRVGIGTSSPGVPLHIADQNPSIRLQSDSGSYQGRNTLGQFDNILYLECDNDNAVSNSAIAFTVDATERMRLTNNGLTFNGDTAAANALDDYEEGTWTPTVTAGASGISVDSGNCNYVKVGAMVVCHFEILSVTSGNSSTLDLGGLPFTPSTEGTFSCMTNSVDWPSSTTMLTGYLNASKWRFYGSQDNGGWVALTGSQLGTGDIIGTIVYRSS